MLDTEPNNQNGPAATANFTEIARDLALRGFAVFPLAERAKFPAISKDEGGNGHRDATTDLDRIEAWGQRYRSANVGIATGLPSNVLVIDVDPRKDGDQTLAELEAVHGSLPATASACTGNGGAHLYFRHVPGVASGNDKLGPGVDIKADGGYVVGPGSLTGPSKDGPGGPYAWICSPAELPIADPPPWLIEKLRPPAKARTSAPARHDIDDTTLVELDEVLDLIKLDDRGDWVRVGNALYHSLGERGRSRWDRCSARSEKFNVNDQDRVWHSFGSSTPTGFGSIFALAQAQGVDLAAIARNHKSKRLTTNDRSKHAPDNNAGTGLPEPGKGRSARNIAAYLEGANVVLRHNAHTDTPHIGRDGECRPLSDADIRRMAMEMHALGIDPPREFLLDCLLDTARKLTFHPVRDYLDMLDWDGKPRLDEWLINYAKTADTPLHRAYGRKTLIGAVRRVRQPGCKFDTALVLIGIQGCNKSTCVRVLAGEHYSDGLEIGSTSKEVIELTAGAWIVELSELAGMRGREAEHVKHFLSRQSDKARLSYDRLTTDRPRQFIVIATTNEDRFLRDSTGNRRFWPVEVGEIDTGALARDRDQLWAEAAHYEAQGEPLELPSELWTDAAASQAARMVVDPWYETLATRLEGKRGLVAISDLWRHLKIDGDRQNPTTAARLHEVMKQLGFEKTRRMRGERREYAFTNDPTGRWLDVF